MVSKSIVLVIFLIKLHSSFKVIAPKLITRSTKSKHCSLNLKTEPTAKITSYFSKRFQQKPIKYSFFLLNCILTTCEFKLVFNLTLNV